MLSTLLYVHIEEKLLRVSLYIVSKVALNPLYTRPVRDSNLTWMTFPSEYRGGGSFWPQILKSLGFPPWEATFVIKTRALSAAAPAQSSFSPATRVKFKKVSLMIFPWGTVIFQVQILFASYTSGKLRLEMWPLEALTYSPEGVQAERERVFIHFFLSLKKKQLQWKRVSMGWWLLRLTIKISQFLRLTVNFFWPFFETFVNQKCYICFLSKKRR